MLKHSENKLNSSPPSPSLTAVEPSHPTPEDKPAKLGVQPISLATGGVPRTTSPINPASIAYPSSNTKPPEQAEKYEHEQLEKSNPGLFQALEEAGVYFAYRDAEGSDIIRSTKEDKRNPRNYPKWKRYLIVGLASWLNNLVCLCVSGYSTGAGQIAEEFNVSAEVVTVGLSLYVLGFAIGPLFTAPLSEFFGRRPVYLVSWFIFTCFQIPLALAPNIGTVLVCRFIQGFSGSTPLANTGGVVHDLFGIRECGLAVAIYALSSVDGPPLGNVVSAFIPPAKGWRWNFWVYLIIFGAHWFIIFFFLPETRDTIIMSRKSQALRAQGFTNVYADHEKDKRKPGYIYKTSLYRPWLFLVKERIVTLSALINGYVYGMIFLSNEAFPLIFGPGNNGHDWDNTGLVNLTFGAYVVGAVIAFAFHPMQERFYQKRSTETGTPNPEARWWISLYGIWLMPLGLMISAWTSYAYLPWIAPLIGFACVGFGFFCIINAILTYVVDGYGHYASSALAGVVFVRNIVGAIFPLFGRQMFERLGNQWALFLLSMLSFLLVSIPFFLYRRGAKVRAKSPYCAENFGKSD
ncbi:polyamine transporter [Filobasidium floriforme]|uniref:polyamine transporter n=1 Tax=Filobasidium floriforme TaxID=5210 RepID=UPI001E8E212A|nr:polyamine transporter [Filobasidium floriforme]KAH8078023.1 polyamine transporter [Filobasidium floriforme]